MDDLFSRERRVARLVADEGAGKAKAMLGGDERRRLVDIAAAVLEDEQQATGFTYSALCMVGLPHKALPPQDTWTRQGANVRLVVEPGRDAEGGFVGVPYGARARVLLIYMTSQAVRTGSRQVQLGRSMSAWMGRLGFAWGGETGRAIKDQCRRVAACHLTFHWEGRGAKGFSKGGIISSGMAFSEPSGAPAWDGVVTLDAGFYEALREHPVPLSEVAVRELRDRSMSLDIYAWLAYRLHSLRRPTTVPWEALRVQFGAGFKLGRQFRPNFLLALSPALAAYPEARVGLHDEGQGIILHPSPPAVRKAGGDLLLSA